LIGLCRISRTEDRCRQELQDQITHPHLQQDLNSSADRSDSDWSHVAHLSECIMKLASASMQSSSSALPQRQDIAEDLDLLSRGNS
jgi:ubiquitin-protein ligase